jgi:multicomponent Na+:H+ antiporter subunit F
MNLFDMSPVDFASNLGLIALSFALVFSFLRLVIGPSLADRVVALDQIAILLVGLLVVYGTGVAHEEPLRVAMVLALISFMGTVGFANYLQRKATR